MLKVIDLLFDIFGQIFFNVEILFGLKGSTKVGIKLGLILLGIFDRLESFG